MSNITRVCSHLWRIENYLTIPQKQGGKLRSMKFSAADDDLNWCLEHTLCIKSLSSNIVSFNLLRPDCYGDLRKYESVSGNVDIILMNGAYRRILCKERSPFTFSFGEQNRICNVAEFSTIPIHDTLSTAGGDLLTLCNITYCKNDDVTISSSNNSNDVRISESRLSSDMERCFTEDRFKDVTISVKGKEYHAHKNILAARSAMFAFMLESEMNQLNITDADHETFEEMLYYIYTGKVKNLDKSARELLPLADEFDLKELRSMCEKVLVKKLTPDDAAMTLFWADKHHAEELKAHAIRVIKENYESCVHFDDRDAWEDLAQTNFPLLKEMVVTFCKRQELD